MNTPSVSTAFGSSGQADYAFGLLPVYLRHETTSDLIVNLTERQKEQSRFKDIVVYADKECRKFLARFPWHYSDKPRKNSRTMQLNCWTWRVEWIQSFKSIDFAIENPAAYKQRLLALWGSELPKSISIMEFFGTASSKDDYILRESGKFTPDWISGDPIASFTTLDAAITAIQNLPNDCRRVNSVIGVLPSWN